VIRLVEDAGVGNHNLDGHRAENLQQVGHVCGLHILMIFAIWDRPSAATCQCVVTKPHIDVKKKLFSLIVASSDSTQGLGSGFGDTAFMRSFSSQPRHKTIKRACAVEHDGIYVTKAKC
jgi:hypothetical protein